MNDFVDAFDNMTEALGRVESKVFDITTDLYCDWYEIYDIVKQELVWRVDE